MDFVGVADTSSATFFMLCCNIEDFDIDGHIVVYTSIFSHTVRTDYRWLDMGKV